MRLYFHSFGRYTQNSMVWVWTRAPSTLTTNSRCAVSTSLTPAGPVPLRHSSCPPTSGSQTLLLFLWHYSSVFSFLLFIFYFLSFHVFFLSFLLFYVFFSFYFSLIHFNICFLWFLLYLYHTWFFRHSDLIFLFD